MIESVIHMKLNHNSGGDKKVEEYKSKGNVAVGLQMVSYSRLWIRDSISGYPSLLDQTINR